MRQFLRHLTLLCLVMALLPAAVALPAAAQTEVVADEELVIINRDDRIVVRDPYTPPGYQPLSWESPQTGFRQVVTGDFNGDGTYEIVGLRGGEAHVFDPFRQSNEANVARVFTAASGQVWQLAATGRFFGGARDGLVLVESLDSGNIRARMIVYLFNPASGWAQNYSQDLGATFQGLAAGDVDGDRADELTGIRSGSGYNQILIFDPSTNWGTMYEGNYAFPWLAVAVGNVQSSGENKQEIVTTRSGVGANLASYLIFRYLDSTTLQDVASENFFPSFKWIALADVTGNGDDEVYLLRPGVQDGTSIVALTSRNPGGDPTSVIEFNELAGQTRFGNIQAGDVDGDGKAEVIVMASNEYIIYTEPASSRAYQSYVGAYSTSLSFAVGNLDGSGIPQGLMVTPATVSLSLQSGQTGTQVVQVTNAGTGTLTWTATVTAGSSWLSVDPTGGSTPAAATLQIDARNLAAAAYTGTVRFSSQSGTTTTTRDVTVNLTVTAPASPVLSVTPTEISLSLESGQSTTRPVQITNTGAGTLNWTASLVQGAPWLSFSPSSGTAPSTLTLTINAAGMQAGQYPGKVRVSAGTTNSPQDITVNLTVTAPPFFVTPSVVSWTYVPPEDPGPRTVRVTGTGIGWHAGVVPMDSVQRIGAAIAAGRLMAINNGFLVLGDGAEDVPIVDYIDVNPSSSTAVQIDVTLSLVLARVPYGLNQAAVVFVADGVASPPAVVVRASVLRTQPGASDLYFVPLIE